MKATVSLILLFCLLGCSREQIQKQEQNLVIQAMTTGQWKVTSYIKGGTDVTSNFSTYTFQFRQNYTVDAYLNTNLDRSGTWNADANARTITSSFTNAGQPLDLLNGTWNYNNSSWTSVEASQTIGGENCTLRLDKL